MAAEPGLRFRPTQRLHRPAEFQQVYRLGRKFGSEFFSVAVSTNQLPQARLGLSIAARTIGNAVQRNRVRRLVRESFRLHQHQLPPVDIVIGARTQARQATSRQLQQGLQQLWDRISATCAR